MQTFELSALLTGRLESGKSWLPFLDVPSSLVGVYVVAADDRETHSPHAMDEVYYVVSGQGVIHVEGEDRSLSPGSIVFVPAMQPHHFHRIEEPLTLLVFFARLGSG